MTARIQPLSTAQTEVSVTSKLAQASAGANFLSWLISMEGGAYPIWAPSGREIFYRNENRMMVVPVETQPTFRAGTPRMLFRGVGCVPQSSYDLAHDDQHLLMIKEKEAPASLKELSITLNWGEELRKRVRRASH